MISTAAGVGTKSAIKDIATALFYWGIPYVKGYGVAVQAMNWQQVSDKKKEHIRKDIKKIAKNISKKKVRVGLRTRFTFYMMRMMQIKDWGASPIEKEYWSKQGWLDDKRPWK